MTKWTDLPAGVVNAATQRFWQECGEDAGLIAERLNTDLFFTGSLGQYLRSGGYTPSPSNQRARQIMGKNMFGVEEALTHFGLMPHSAELARLTGMPFSERVLESYKNTHILVATLPISIQQIGKKASITLRLFKVTDGQDKRFSEARGEEAGWHLIRKATVEGSTYKTWEQQQGLLGRFEEVPKAQLMVYTIVGHYKATGERLFHRSSVRCAELCSDGTRRVVGCFDCDGLYIDCIGDDESGSGIGLAAVEKT